MIPYHQNFLKILVIFCKSEFTKQNPRAVLHSLLTYLVRHKYIFDSGDCSDTLLGRSASWCGCRNTYQTCSLCSDGVSKPQYLGRIDHVYYGWNCEVFEYIASMFNENECSRLFTEILEFDAESFCGCPNTNPDGPGVCQLCDDGDEVLFPDLIVNDESDLSCNDIETSTRYIPSIEPCDKVRTSYAEDGTIGRCCGDPNSKKKWLQNKNGQGIGEQLQDMELLDFNKQRPGTIMVWIGIGDYCCSTSLCKASSIIFDEPLCLTATGNPIQLNAA